MFCSLFQNYLADISTLAADIDTCGRIEHTHALKVEIFHRSVGIGASIGQGYATRGGVYGTDGFHGKNVIAFVFGIYGG